METSKTQTDRSDSEVRLAELDERLPNNVWIRITAWRGLFIANQGY